MFIDFLLLKTEFMQIKIYQEKQIISKANITLHK